VKTFSCVLLAVGAAYGQPANRTTFEVISVKHAEGERMLGTSRGGPGTTSPGRIEYSGVTLKDLLYKAYYPLEPYRLVAPDWMDSDFLDAVVKVPPGTTKEEVRVMLQNLLAERFKLRFHNEPKMMRGFALVSSGRTKITLAAPLSQDPLVLSAASTFSVDKDGFLVIHGGTGGIMMRPPSNGVRRLSAEHQDMDAAALFFTHILQQPVVNETGLAGFYDFHLLFSAEDAMPPDGRETGPISAAAADPAPTLIQAVKLQLGLELVPKMLPGNIFVIDHLERDPVEN
jgi:uncharacterized protein (TIGR03435 family)